MAEHHVADKDPQHKNSLREILEPFFVANQIPLRYDRFLEDTMIIFIVCAVRVTDIIESIIWHRGACEVSRGCEEYDAHLMPGHGEFDKEYDEAYPYLPFSERSDGFR